MDKVLKQRLIGASILIALAVIFIPMLFDAPEDDLGDRQMRIEIPDPPSDRPAVRRMPLDPDSTRASADGASQADQGRPGAAAATERPSDEVMAESSSDASSSQPQEPTPATAQPIAEPRSAAETQEPMPAQPESDTADEPSPATPVSSGETLSSAQSPRTGGDWVLQVASFSVEEYASDLLDQLTRLGHVASINQRVRGDTTLHRVLTGPYATRRDAERAKSQIERTVTGVAPVVRGNPSAAGAAGDSDDRGVGYAVQVGSFASRNNAVRLLGQLEGENFDAFIHEDLSGRRTIWRVRVGLTETRDEATRLLSDIADRTALEGLVVSHP
jgi:DedD protein